MDWRRFMRCAQAGGDDGVCVTSPALELPIVPVRHEYFVTVHCPGIVPTLPASHSMMPGNIKEEIARIDVPVLLSAGDRDMVGPPRELPMQFAAANDITLIVIDKCGHHPFASANTPRFMARAAEWIHAQAK